LEVGALVFENYIQRETLKRCSRRFANFATIIFKLLLKR
uniref:IS5/IS1182 family transposase n=1 Tax=Brugia timori TaxID=42155 RepID=A0A0R3QHZ6_9BILA